MKRIVKFRAQRIDNGEWLCNGTLMQMDGQDGVTYYYMAKHGDLFSFFLDDDGIVTELDGHMYQVNPDTLCQALGAQDATGRDIYEDDIVEYSGNLYRVTYLRKRGKYVGWSDATKYRTLGFGNCTIVGNVFDDPDMLGVKP